ncbi:MAG: isoprenyl transferase [Magnetococcales bacterium]|nr:isoprenyl transferase [Magnetococcales bacterium]MBF0322019.1 isoprenyl transferase [Magnetococcales bacterium]
MNELKKEQLPRHVAIVMDGNRRWAKSRFLPRLEGHRQGVKAVRRTIEACIDFKIPTLTLYTFSSENWNRPAEEVSALMNLLALHLRKEMDELVKEGVRFRALGRIQELAPNIRDLVREMEDKTRHNTVLNFNIALNYGGRQELVDAVRGIVAKSQAGQISSPLEITEAYIHQYLTTAGQPDPDLLIRTGGERRISNFLLWQVAYTELVFMSIHWPDFNRDHLHEAIMEYSHRERRFGAAQ